MQSEREQEIANLRAFNRAYTRSLGLLEAYLDGSPFTLSEARILYEIASRDEPTAAEIRRALSLDRAQVSRTLKRFAERGLIQSRQDPERGRNQLLSLTPDGRNAFAALDANTRAAVGDMLDAMTPFRSKRLLSAAAVMTDILSAKSPPAVRLRDPVPGDLGLVISRQAVLYAQEFGWNADYEALVARILAEFHEHFDPAKDAGWIAEMDGAIVGSIFLVCGEAAGVGKLRLLYVEPETRGAGIGKLLVRACIERARALGYQRLDLWTNSVLAAARRIYQQAGFMLISEEPHRSFGHDLVGQNWSLALDEDQKCEGQALTAGLE